MKYFKTFKALAAGAVMALALSACDSDVFDINVDPFKDQTYKNILNSPISVYVDSVPELSEYAKALKYSGMYNALNQSTQGVSFTALVPNNEAMQEFYQRRGVTALEELSEDYVRSFVLYHTLPDSITTEKFITTKSVTNLADESIAITIDPNNAGQATLNDKGQVVEMGISAYNGKVYVLSKAMTPLVETVYDRIVEAGESSIMVDALRETGWDKELMTLADTLVEDGKKTVIKRYYTLLNVTDETFGKAGIGSLDALKLKLKADDDRGLAEDSLLNEYVSYHILNNTYTTADFASTGSTDTKIISSMAKNQVLSVKTDTLAAAETDRYVFNGAGESAKFVPEASNVLSKNGYVHQLSAWLPVWEPEQAVLVWDLADNAEIKSLVQSAGVEYQPAEAVTKEDIVNVANASCFTYEVGEGGSAPKSSYHNIDYVTSKAYKVGTESSTAVNNDRIVFNVGYMGSVQMTTPTIVKGKYKVEITIAYLMDHSFMRTLKEGNGGLMRMTFDDRDDATVYVSPYTKVTSALAGFFTSTIYDEVEFTETAAHDFKFVVLDPTASSNSKFSLQFDCITFTPIE